MAIFTLVKVSGEMSEIEVKADNYASEKITSILGGKPVTIYGNNDMAVIYNPKGNGLNLKASSILTTMYDGITGDVSNLRKVLITYLNKKMVATEML